MVLSKQQSAPIVVRPFFSLDQIETSSFPARYTKWHWLACGSPIRKLPSCQPVRPPLSRSVQRGSFPHRHGGTSTLTLKEFLTDAMPMPQARFARARSKPLLVAPDAGRPQKPLYTTSRPLHNDLLLGGEHLFWLLHLLSREIEQSRWFKAPVRLAVHGGAQVVLSEAFRHLPGARGATRDIDYISHTRERAAINAGYSDACLHKCVKRAAKASASWVRAG